MKKTYIQPNIKVVNVETNFTLLTVSGVGSTGDTTWSDAFGGEAGADDEAGARGQNLWNDEE